MTSPLLPSEPCSDHSPWSTPEKAAFFETLQTALSHLELIIKSWCPPPCLEPTPDDPDIEYQRSLLVAILYSANQLQICLDKYRAYITHGFPY